MVEADMEIATLNKQKKTFVRVVEKQYNLQCN